MNQPRSARVFVRHLVRADPAEPPDRKGEQILIPVDSGPFPCRNDTAVTFGRPKSNMEGWVTITPMKAVLFHQHGGPEVLEYADFPTPEPKPGEALVRLRAAALNRVDVFVRNGWAGLKLDLPPGLLLFFFYLLLL